MADVPERKLATSFFGKMYVDLLHIATGLMVLKCNI